MGSGCSKQGGRDKEGSRRRDIRDVGTEETDCPVHSPADALFPSSWLDCPSWGHLFISKAPMGEGREVGDTVGSLRQASQGVDLTVRDILVLPEIDGVG